MEEQVKLTLYCSGENSAGNGHVSVLAAWPCLGHN